MNSRSYSKDYNYLIKEGCYKSNKVWCDSTGTPIGKGRKTAPGAAKDLRKIQKIAGMPVLSKLDKKVKIKKVKEDDELFTWEDYETI